VPDDVSVIAIDGIEISNYLIPTLTTLCQPKDRLGEEAVRILVDVLEGRAGNRHIRLETTPRLGGTVKSL
jgi:DNA-binding LacI/PurR family transcriptional regulator